MLLRGHILIGLIFTLLIWAIIPKMPLVYLALIFLSSFLIDFDHYVVSFSKTKKWRLGDAFEYHRKKGVEERRDIAQGIRRKSDFHLFHTLEFHFIVGVLGIFFIAFFYIFIGMILHSLLDVFDLLSRGAFHRREYFFSNWARKKIKK